MLVKMILSYFSRLSAELPAFASLLLSSSSLRFLRWLSWGYGLGKQHQQDPKETLSAALLLLYLFFCVLGCTPLSHCTSAFSRTASHSLPTRTLSVQQRHNVTLVMTQKLHFFPIENWIFPPGTPNQIVATKILNFFAFINTFPSSASTPPQKGR